MKYSENCTSFSQIVSKRVMSISYVPGIVLDAEDSGE